MLVITQHSTFLGFTGMQTEHKRAKAFDGSSSRSPLVPQVYDPKPER
jgi:hypothetical protein